MRGGYIGLMRCVGEEYIGGAVRGVSGRLREHPAYH